MRRLAALMIILAFSLLPGSPSLALESPPDTIVIHDVYAVRNTPNDGDMAIAVRYYIEDDSYTTPSSQTMFIRLYDTDGTTLIDSVIPVVYFGYGYDNNVCMFYFTESDNLTYGSEFVINIAGSPAFWDPLPDPVTYTMTVADWSSATSLEANQENMENWVLSAAQQLEYAYPTYSLYGSAGGSNVLTEDGEAFFRQAMPGIQGIAPGVFLTQFYIPTAQALAIGDDQASTYADRMNNTDLADGLDAIGDLLGTEGSSIAGGVLILACVALCIWCIRKDWGIHPAIIGSSIILTAGAVVLGDAFMAVRLVMGLIAAILLMYMFFFKKG